MMTYILMLKGDNHKRDGTITIKKRKIWINLEKGKQYKHDTFKKHYDNNADAIRAGNTRGR